MKIALFHNLPPGGAKRAVFEWTKQLSKVHKIDLFIFNDKSETTWDVKPFANKIFIQNESQKKLPKEVNRLFSLIPIIFQSKKLANKIDEEKYDLVLTMQCKITNSPFLLRFLKTPSFYICHEPMARVFEPHYPKKYITFPFNFLRKIGLNFFIGIDKKNANYADSICTTSYYSRERLYLCYGLFPKVIYPGVDTNFFKPIKRIVRKKIILSVGSLFPSKGHEFVIESLGRINKSERPSLKIIHGAHQYLTSYKIKLKMLAKKYNVQVSFVSSIDDKTLLKEYNSSKITVCANFLEPLGLVALESMACGTPVVAIKEAGLRETIVNNKNGILTDRDSLEFSKAIMELIKNQDKWNRMSKNGIKCVSDKWTWEFSAKSLDKYLKSFIGKQFS
ncbi:glycosyltransferase family 4 protein [Nitrosomonadales bacterium]|nr:glycosyltransferase family 4 protein [Nitrosomonadales bacterium]